MLEQTQRDKVFDNVAARQMLNADGGYIATLWQADANDGVDDGNVDGDDDSDSRIDGIQWPPQTSFSLSLDCRVLRQHLLILHLAM